MAPPAARDLTSNTEGKQKQTTKVDINQLRSSPPLKILVGNHYFPILKVLGGGWEKPLPEPVEKQILMLLEFENAATQGNYHFRSSWRISKRTSPSSHSLYIGQELEGWYSSIPAQCFTIGTLRLYNRRRFPMRADCTGQVQVMEIQGLRFSNDSSDSA